MKIKYFLFLVFIFYVLILAYNSKDGFPSRGNNIISFPFLSEKPLTEDGYYALTIAWNLGTGKGIVYNYDIVTTGFQPLYVFTLAPVAWLLNYMGYGKTEFLRFVIVYSGFLILLFFYLLRILTRLLSKNVNKNEFELILILMVLFSYKVFLQFFNGLETGLYLCFVCFSIILSIKIFSQKLSEIYYLLFGVVLGFTVLARIDFLLPAACVILFLAYQKKVNLKQLSLITFFLFITIAPWFFYVYKTTGSIFPTSVLVQSRFLSSFELYDRIDKFFFALLNPVVPFFYTGLTNTLIFYFPSAIIVTILIRSFLKERFKLFNSDKLKIIYIWGLSILLLIGVYFFLASVPYFYPRYFSPFYVVSIPILAITLSKYFNWKKAAAFKILFLISISLFIMNSIGGLFYKKSTASLANRLSVLQDEFYKNKKIGMFQSGIGGYYFDNVLNLDGKVNHYALNYSKRGELEKYLDSLGVEILLDWKEYFSLLDKQYLYENWEQSNIVFLDGKSVMYSRKGVKYKN